MKSHRHPVLPKHHRTGDEHHRRTERQQWIFQNKIARHSNIIAGIGVTFSIIAAIGAFVAACYAGGAYYQAKTQTAIAQKAFVVSNRAFVYFGPPTFSVDYENASQFNVLIPMGNAGNTPTVGISYEMGCFPSPNQNQVWVNSKRGRPTATFGTVGPKVIETPIACRLTLGTNGIVTDKYGDTSRSFLVEGRATYFDVLQPTVQHETRFCYGLFNFHGETKTTIMDGESVPCRQHNCTDDECKKDGPWPPLF